MGTIQIFNFAHPFTEAQQVQLTQMLDEPFDVRLVPTQIDRGVLLAEAARTLADAVGLTPDAWQTMPFIINPPSLAPLALAVMAEIHGRCGHFPAILNIRPVPSMLGTSYEIAEIVNLQALRETARTRRA